MDLRSYDLNSIRWAKKAHTAGSDNDISVFYGKDGCVSFVFRNNVLENITSTGYMQIGRVGSALVFREATKATGLKATMKPSGNYHLSTRNALISEYAKKYSGNFTARLFKNYIYIDGESNKED